MEDGVVVISAGSQGQEVSAGLGAKLAEEFDLDIPVSGVECQRHSIIKMI